MKTLYQKIHENLSCLPVKDKELCLKFLAQEDYISISEIVESCLKLKKRDDRKKIHQDKWVNVDRDKLEQLTLDIRECLINRELSEVFEEDEYE